MLELEEPVSCSPLSEAPERTHLGTKSCFVRRHVVRVGGRHHVVPHSQEELHRANTGGEPCGVLVYLELLTNTHDWLTLLLYCY